MNSLYKPKPLMIFGTSSGAGKSLITTAICGLLRSKGENPLPFKGQNMSNNAWIDINGGEMAYSQAVQAWASGISPICSMNPILLKPQGDCISEIIHLGKSVGITKAKSYYDNWFYSGWSAIEKGLKDLKSQYPEGRLIAEGAGSPVEINLQHRDLTNLKLANYLNADCLLVADIERGGVFAQIIGTLALLSPADRRLIKGIIINKFRGEISLFDSGREWIEKETKIPVLGILPWLNELFPAEDSLDLLNKRPVKNNAEIEIVVVKFSRLSNFSDIEPLEFEPSVKLRWVKPGESLGTPDAVILPGSKQTVKDLKEIITSGLGNQLKLYAEGGGILFGICGGLQMLGMSLQDPFKLEQDQNLNKKISSKTLEGLKLIPISTVFEKEKCLRRVNTEAKWPNHTVISGFELHHGRSYSHESSQKNFKHIFKDTNLGWTYENDKHGIVSGTYIHGIFENALWRRLWLNEVRKKKNLSPLSINVENFKSVRKRQIERLVESFQSNIDLSKIIKA